MVLKPKLFENWFKVIILFCIDDRYYDTYRNVRIIVRRVAHNGVMSQIMILH